MVAFVLGHKESISTMPGVKVEWSHQVARDFGSVRQVNCPEILFQGILELTRLD